MAEMIVNDLLSSSVWYIIVERALSEYVYSFYL